jgi:pyridoxamine 5'-phosphate oxidase family protein
MMSVFTDEELEYIAGGRLGRLATVGVDGMPHVAPLRPFFDRDTDTFVIGGRGDFAATKKFRDAERHGLAALVIDDVGSFDPFTPRGIEIRGRVEAHSEGGADIGRGLGAPYPLGDAWLRIIPVRIVSWGLHGEPFGPPLARTVG